MARPDENERRNTSEDLPQASLGKFEFVTGCMWLVGIAVVALITWGIVLVARRFL